MPSWQAGLRVGCRKGRSMSAMDQPLDAPRGIPFAKCRTIGAPDRGSSETLQQAETTLWRRTCAPHNPLGCGEMCECPHWQYVHRASPAVTGWRAASRYLLHCADGRTLGGQWIIQGAGMGADKYMPATQYQPDYCAKRPPWWHETRYRGTGHGTRH